MTFDSRETSRDDASWVEFLLFQRGGQKWRYTFEHQTTVFQGASHFSAPGLRRGPIQQSDEDVTMQLRITLPRTASIAQEFIGSPVPEPISVTLYRNHRGESDAEALPAWWGEVSSARFVGSELELLCSTEESVFGGQLGRMKFSRNCGNMLGDELCGVDMELHTFPATVTAVDPFGREVTVTGPADLGASPSHYQRGQLVWGVQRSLILAEASPGVFTLQTALPTLTPGALGVLVKRGCDRTHLMCDTVFNNLDRIQAYPLIPLRDVNKRLI